MQMICYFFYDWFAIDNLAVQFVKSFFYIICIH